MNSNKIAQCVLIGVGVVALLLLLPVIIVVGMSGFLFGLVVACGLLAAAAVAALANSVQRVVRNRAARSVTTSTPRTRQIAAELGVPLVESVRPSEKPVEIFVRLSEGGCPLMRETGDVIRIAPDGRLSAPLCSPSAAAVQRLLRTRGLESGSTAHCVCPVGPYELTFALNAA
jgi:hypothetical protein